MDDELTLQTSRILPYSPDAVYDAFASADMLASWWGPDGFTNEFEVFEFRTGGQWKFVMRAPDGREYPNESVFASLEPGISVVIEHRCPPYFTLTVGLERTAGGTRITWSQRFADANTARAVRHIVEPSNEQNLDRLALALHRSAGAA